MTTDYTTYVAGTRQCEPSGDWLPVVLLGERVVDSGYPATAEGTAAAQESAETLNAWAAEDPRTDLTTPTFCESHPKSLWPHDDCAGPGMWLPNCELRWHGLVRPTVAPPLPPSESDINLHLTGVVVSPGQSLIISLPEAYMTWEIHSMFRRQIKDEFKWPVGVAFVPDGAKVTGVEFEAEPRGPEEKACPDVRHPHHGHPWRSGPTGEHTDYWCSGFQYASDAYVASLVEAEPCRMAVSTVSAPAAAVGTRGDTLIDVVFDGGPGPVSGRFVETEDASGHGIGIGEWVDRGDGTWALRIPVAVTLIRSSCECFK